MQKTIEGLGKHQQTPSEQLRSSFESHSPLIFDWQIGHIARCPSKTSRISYMMHDVLKFLKQLCGTWFYFVHQVDHTVLAMAYCELERRGVLRFNHS